MSGDHAGPTMEDLLRRLEQGTVPGFPASVDSNRPGSPAFLNVYGVLLLRRGKVYEALTVYNKIALDQDTLGVRPDVPDSFKANLATARLLAKNPLGCLEALRLVSDRRNEYCLRLRRAVHSWTRSLPLLSRLTWRLGILPRAPIRLNFVPGQLEGDNTDGKASHET